MNEIEETIKLLGRTEATIKELLEMQENAKQFAKQCEAEINALCFELFHQPAEAIRQAKKKEEGAVTVPGDLLEVTSTKRKDVKWDQAELISIASQISQDGGNPYEYIDAKYSVKESKFSAWPSDIKEKFQKARHVDIKPETFKVKLVEV